MKPFEKVRRIDRREIAAQGGRIAEGNSPTLPYFFIVFRWMRIDGSAAFEERLHFEKERTKKALLSDCTESNFIGSGPVAF